MADCKAAPATPPNATPTNKPAKSRGTREATNTAVSWSVPPPVSSPPNSWKGPTSAVPCVRWISENRARMTTPPRQPPRPVRSDGGHFVQSTRQGREHPPRPWERSWRASSQCRSCGWDYLVRDATIASTYWVIDAGPPNIQMPSERRCTLPADTNGSDFQTALSVNCSVKSPSALLVM